MECHFPRIRQITASDDHHNDGGLLEAQIYGGHYSLTLPPIYCVLSGREWSARLSGCSLTGVPMYGRLCVQL